MKTFVFNQLQLCKYKERNDKSKFFGHECLEREKCRQSSYVRGFRLLLRWNLLEILCRAYWKCKGIAYAFMGKTDVKMMGRMLVEGTIPPSPTSPSFLVDRHYSHASLRCGRKVIGMEWLPITELKTHSFQEFRSHGPP